MKRQKKQDRGRNKEKKQKEKQRKISNCITEKTIFLRNIQNSGSSNNCILSSRKFLTIKRVPFSLLNIIIDKAGRATHIHRESDR